MYIAEAEEDLYCCRTAARHRRAGLRPLVDASLFPAKRRILRVGDAGFEPATSAV
jgi:hypothetical protein